MLRRIVLDANILVRAVLGKRVRELIEQYGGDVAFFTPAIAFEEAERHLPSIAAKRDRDPAALVEALAWPSRRLTARLAFLKVSEQCALSS